MKRKILESLKEWKASVHRKPMILSGARQVGKTWVMKEFAQTCYDSYVYLNFEDNEALRNLFAADLHPQRIISSLSIITQTEITENTLIIFDEIQSAKRGITSLKYFCEEAPQYHLIAAGSLLGIAMHHNDSFPVGKVDMLTMYPLDFEEFLMATGNGKFAEMLRINDWSLAQACHQRLTELLKIYYYVGGMPEVVNAYVDNRGLQEVRLLQKNILMHYENDFGKHAPAAQLPRIRMVWQSILAQLSKENKKYIYGQVRKGARAAEFEMAIMWLQDAGIVHKVTRVKSGEYPIKAFEDFVSFKLFLVDVGLLGAMGDIDSNVIFSGNDLFSTFKGALAEQYVLQQLTSNRRKIGSDAHYWSADNSRGEVDFVVQHAGTVVPIEVKAEENLKAKSLRTFCEKYHIERGLRFSMSPFREQDWMTNYPLYSIPFVW